MKIGRYLVGMVSGLTFGMLFAPKKGKELRKKMSQKGKNGKTEDALKELGKAYQEAWDDVSKELKNLKDSDQVKAAFETFEGKFKDLLDIAEERGGDAAAVAQEKMEEIASMAKDKAEKLKKKATKKARSTAKRATKKARSTAKRTTKKAKSTAKKAATTAKSKARKTAKKATKRK